MKFLLYLASLMIVLQPMNQALIFLNYRLNKNYIVRQLCVNKAKPQMHCEGKCHLRKQLKKDEEEQKKDTKGVKEFSQIIYFFEEADSALVLHDGVKTAFAPEMKILYPSFPVKIFHPPASSFC